MQPESQPQRGRPSEYSQELADTICDEIITGASMASICAKADRPSESMVYRWLGEHAYFRERLAGAREVQADRMMHQILEITDDASRDVVEVEGWDGKPQYRERFTASARDKLKIDARFKLMALLAPKKYGTKQLDITSGGQKLSGIQLVDFDGSPVTDL